jgi:alkanesulfonate monooxygenase SsuD/methylene tetrahydromethanopterin reductase-like flavin-dependent oxidoreductase (luciferase family)
MIPLSVLDLSPIVQVGTAAQAFRHTRELAQHAERLGHSRFWVAARVERHQAQDPLGPERLHVLPQL